MIPVLKELSKENLENKIIISLAAGVGEKILKKYLGNAQSVFRVMANLSATIQSGVFGIFEVKPNAKDRKIIETKKRESAGSHACRRIISPRGKTFPVSPRVSLEIR